VRLFEPRSAGWQLRPGAVRQLRRPSTRFGLVGWVWSRGSSGPSCPPSGRSALRTRTRRSVSGNCARATKLDDRQRQRDPV